MRYTVPAVPDWGICNKLQYAQGQQNWWSKFENSREGVSSSDIGLSKSKSKDKWISIALSQVKAKEKDLNK